MSGAAPSLRRVARNSRPNEPACRTRALLRGGVGVRGGGRVPRLGVIGSGGARGGAACRAPRHGPPGRPLRKRHRSRRPSPGRSIPTPLRRCSMRSRRIPRIRQRGPRSETSISTRSTSGRRRTGSSRRGTSIRGPRHSEPPRLCPTGRRRRCRGDRGLRSGVGRGPRALREPRRAGPDSALRRAGSGHRNRTLGAGDRGAAGFARGGGAEGPDRVAADRASVRPGPRLGMVGYARSESECCLQNTLSR